MEKEQIISLVENVVRETVQALALVTVKNAGASYAVIRRKYELSGPAESTIYRRVGITVHNAYNLQSRNKCFLYSLDFQGETYFDKEFTNSSQAMSTAKAHVDRIGSEAADKVITKSDFKNLAERTA